MKKLFVILGEASSGKDTILKEVVKGLYNTEIAVSFTTRPMRDGEVEGREYNFISTNEFNRLFDSGQIVESTSYDVANGENWLYGLTRAELEKSEYVAVITNPHGLNQLKKVYGEKVVSIYITANGKDRVIRYLNREHKVDNLKVAECCRRFLADEKDFKKLRTDYTVINDNNTKLEDAVSIVRSIISRCSANETLESMNEDFKRNPARFLKCN